MPRSRIERNEPLRWIGWGALVLVLALGGAYLIVSRINRPLRELTRAADADGARHDAAAGDRDRARPKSARSRARSTRWRPT